MSPWFKAIWRGIGGLAFLAFWVWVALTWSSR
jgi:hypothetical protein